MSTLDRIDWYRDEAKNLSTCRKCGSRDAARLDALGCEDCVEFDRCFYCKRFVAEPDEVNAYLAGYRWVDDAESKAEVVICDACFGSAA